MLYWYMIAGTTGILSSSTTAGTRSIAIWVYYLNVLYVGGSGQSDKRSSGSVLSKDSELRN